MYDIRTGDDVADAQVDALADAEFDILMELFEVLRLTPGNGRVHVPGGNMYVWDHRGISVLYYVLEEQREVVVLRVDRFPVLSGPRGLAGEHGPHQLKVILGHSGVRLVQVIPAVHPVPEVPAACPVPDDRQPVAYRRRHTGRIEQREPPGIRCAIAR